VLLGLPLILCGGGSVAVISSTGEDTPSTPLALNLPDLLQGGEALGGLSLINKRTPTAVGLRPLSPPFYKHGSWLLPATKLAICGSS
jgi:hypothetical protein